MARSFGLVDYKVQEAEYFLDQLLHTGKRLNFMEVQFCGSAFVTALRSVTFAMQASLKGTPQFDDWYSLKQAKLRNDPLAKFFHDFRTVTNHIGANLVGGGLNDRSGTKYFFLPCHDLPNVPDLDVATACQMQFISVLELVFECYIEFATLINGQHYFTEEHFHAQGKTVEDAEEELGYPRGWTKLGLPVDAEWRWKVLRKSADGCLIAHQFERWLNKSLPHPDDMQ